MSSTWRATAAHTPSSATTSPAAKHATIGAGERQLQGECRAPRADRALHGKLEAQQVAGHVVQAVGGGWVERGK
ncbi:hypothetical protein GCM10022224_030300 [Nonomuraea antimicrobica]|uniref:Uncharacterized protein n=1 Tax=Nonomuraea antimicrobica TaxID=561173 RepID=A0ABP7BND0_9ACTN